MKIEKKDLTTSSNARITISYKGKKPKIEFGYPTKNKKKVEGYILRYIYYFSLIGTGIAVFIHQVISGIEGKGFAIAILVAFFLNMLLLRLTLGVWLKKRFQNIAIWESMIFAGAFYSKKWIKVPKSKILEIPLFNNVKLDYIAKGEFSKYLKELRIKEYPFKANKINWFMGKRIERDNQEYLWSARFYFNEIPKKGSLEVFWK